MTTYEGFPGHEEIRNEMDFPSETETDGNKSDMPRQISSSSGENLPCAPPCSLSGSSENLTPNLDTTGMLKKGTLSRKGTREGLSEFSLEPV